MKTKILSLISVLSLAVFTSCVQDDDYKIPEMEIVEPNITANTTIQIVKDMYSGALVNFSDASNGGELIMEGYVVSNDEAGNFYKVLILQDKPENPTAAIQLDIDDATLFDLYKPGRKVYVKLNPQGLPSLGMTSLNNVLHIGRINGSTVERMSLSNYQDYIFRSAEMATLVPRVITPAEFNDSLINILVQIDNMQLNLAEVGQPYANAGDTYTVNRMLKNCEDNSMTIIRNSGFADFKGELFPTGMGSIVSVFSKYNNDYQLFIRDTDDINFDGERCDPVAACTGTASGGSTIFSETFESYSNISGAESAGWTNVNVSGGTLRYILGSFNNNKYAQISGFGSGQSVIDAWLVTPAINLDSTTGESLSFDMEVAYSTGVILSILITNNYTGDVTTTEWTPLSVDIPNTPTNAFGGFNSYNDINISCFDGDVRIAFHYEGSDPSATTRYHIDNVTIKGH